MTKGSKRGFIPPQPAAALSGMDFAHASEAYRRALEVPASTPGASDFLDQCADRLIVIPTTNPLQIASLLHRPLVLAPAGAVVQPREVVGHDSGKGVAKQWRDSTANGGWWLA